MMTLRDAAALVHCNVKTLRRRIGDGRLLAYRMGGLLRVRRVDLLAAFSLFTPRPVGLDDFISEQCGK